MTYDFRDDGAIWLGFVDGMDIWMLEDFVVNPATGVEGYLIPAKKVLIAGAAPATRVYGSVEIGSETGITVEATARYVDVYGAKDPAGVTIQIHSAPLLVTNHPDAYSAITVLT
jgi:hypothetical protein